jgi:hypothetical protein
MFMLGTLESKFKNTSISSWMSVCLSFTGKRMFIQYYIGKSYPLKFVYILVRILVKIGQR